MFCAIFNFQTRSKKLVQELIQEEENDGKSRKGNVRT